MRRLAPFVLAGGSGFATDAAALYALTGPAGLDPFLARLVSFTLAMGVTFVINRHLTFGPSGRTLLAESARYFGVAAGVGLFNYLVYAGLLLAVPGLKPLAALVVSSAAAMALSFLGYGRLVFRAG